MRLEAELKVGVMVVVAGVLLAVLLTMASNWTIGTPGDELTVQFDSISHLMRGAAVHLSGVSVGKVIGIRLGDEDRVEVRVRIDPPIGLREGLTAELGMLGFVGETFVMLKNGPLGNPSLDWSKPVQGTQAADTSALLEKLGTGMDELIATADAIRGFIDENGEQIADTAESTRAFMASTTDTLDELTARVGPVLDQASATLEKVDERLPGLLDDADALIGTTREEVTAARQDLAGVRSAAEQWVEGGRTATTTLASDAGAALAEVRESVKTLTEAATELQSELTTVVNDAGNALATEQTRLNESMAALDEALAEARGLLARVDRLAQKVETGQGALGQLMSDDTVVPAMHTTLDSATRALSELERVSESVAGLASGRRPEARVGLELTYRGAVRGLQPELGLWLSPSDGRAFYGAVTTRDGDQRYSAVIAQRLGPVWARAGFVDSEAALGLDWQVLPRVVLRGEALRVTRPLFDTNDDLELPRFDAEMMWSALPRTQVILGAEDVGRDVGFVIGLRSGL